MLKRCGMLLQQLLPLMCNIKHLLVGWHGTLEGQLEVVCWGGYPGQASLLLCFPRQMSLGPAREKTSKVRRPMVTIRTASMTWAGAVAPSAKQDCVAMKGGGVQRPSDASIPWEPGGVSNAPCETGVFAARLSFPPFAELRLSLLPDVPEHSIMPELHDLSPDRLRARSAATGRSRADSCGHCGH